MNDEDTGLAEIYAAGLVLAAEFAIGSILAIAAAIAVPGLPWLIQVLIIGGTWYAAGEVDEPVVQHATRKIEERWNRP